MRVDPAGWDLSLRVRHVAVVEDEQLVDTVALARHVPDNPLADEGMDEVAALAPELEVGADRHPAAENRPVVTHVLPSLREKPGRLDLDIVALRVLCHADLANELDVDSRLLHHLADRGLSDGLTRLDPAARHDRAVLRHPGDVEDEQLVETRLRVLARYVGGDRRAGSQLFWARILAL